MQSLGWINTTRLFACTVALLAAAMLSHATPVAALVCNGADYLCERRYDQVIFPTNHNSHAYRDADAPTWRTPNQNKTIPEQLGDGVRGLMWDVYYRTQSGFINLALCHEATENNCLGGFRYLSTALGYLKAFLDANPGEVVTIIFESFVAPNDLVVAFTDAGLANYLFSHTAGQAWPTLGDMVVSGRRLVVFVSNLEDPDGSTQRFAIGPNGAWSGEDRPGYENYGQWLHSEWSLAFETPFDYAIYSGPLRGLGEDKPAYCMPHMEDKDGFRIRGNPSGLYILNHFITPPGTTPADAVNPFGFLLRSARYCGTIYHRLPNFLAVDFYNHPNNDAVQVVHRLNRTALVCPAFLSQQTDPGQCSATLHFPPLVHDTNLDCQLSANVMPGDAVPVGTYSPGGVALNSCGQSEDGVDLSQHCSFAITVYDAENPVVACGVGVSVLSPRNSSLVNVGLTASAADNCGTSPIQVSVFSNEGDVGAASHPQFSPDATDIAPGTLRLRAEADAKGDGRVYLIVTKTEDSTGNGGSCAQTVVVPTSKSPSDATFVNGKAAEAKAYYDAHGQAPAGFVQLGNGPVIGPKQ